MKPSPPLPSAPPPPESSWRRLALNPGAPVDVDSISETVEAVFASFEAGSAPKLDFSGLDPTGVSAEHLAAALRACSMARDDIPSWHGGLLVAIDACAIQGVDASDALAGLL